MTKRWMWFALVALVGALAIWIGIPFTPRHSVARYVWAAVGGMIAVFGLQGCVRELVRERPRFRRDNPMNEPDRPRRDVSIEEAERMPMSEEELNVLEQCVRSHQSWMTSTRTPVQQEWWSRQYGADVAALVAEVRRLRGEVDECPYKGVAPRRSHAHGDRVPPLEGPQHRGAPGVTITDFLEYLTGQVDGQPWRERANCKGMGPAMFLPERGESSREAKAVCRSCPVRAECLDYALEHHERWGIWGGTSDRQRRMLRRRELEVVA